MGNPDAQGLSQCSYCGTKIILPPTDAAKENKNLVRCKELCKVARQAGNWKDLLTYASQILEIDPRNLDAWIDKALAAGSLSNWLIPRLDEAMGYLKQAGDLSPNDPRIAETTTIVQEVQFNQFMYKGLDTSQSALYAINLGSVGRDHAVKWIVEAMGYYLGAFKIKPNDPTTQQSILTIAQYGKRAGVEWYQEVQTVLQRIDQSRSRQAEAEQKARQQQAAAQRLQSLRQKLQQRQAELEKLKHKQGLFVRMNIEDVQDEIKKLSTEIRQLEPTTQGQT
jgi:tetratricopeptide (TPR) repeat protein